MSEVTSVPKLSPAEKGPRVESLRLSSLGRWGLVVLLAIAPLAWSLGRPWVLVGLGLLSVFVAAMGFFSSGASRLRLGGAELALLIWVLISALQVVPLPFGVVEALAPEVAHHYLEVYGLYGERPEWVSLSVAPGRSALALWGAISFLSVFLAARIFLAGRLKWVLPKLLVGAGVVLFFAAAKTFWVSMEPGGVLALESPLGDATAAYFGLFSALSLGVALHSEGGQRNGALLVYLVMTLAMLATLKGMTLVTWGGAHLIFLLLAQSWRLGSRRWLFVLVGVLTLLLGGSLGLAKKELSAPLEQVFSRFEAQSAGARGLSPELAEVLDLEPGVVLESPEQSQPPEIGAELRALVWRFAPLGSGRGSFQEVYTAFGRGEVLGHAENEYLEFAVEFGPWLTIVFFLLMGIGLLGSLSRVEAGDRLVWAGVGMALLFVALNSLHDDTFRSPGVGLVFFALFGALERRKRKGYGRWPLAVGLVMALIIAIPLAPGALRSGARSDLEEVRAMVDILRPEEAGPESSQELLKLARVAAEDRPLDSYLRFVVGLGLLRAGDPYEAERWLLSALTLSTRDARVHLLLGRIYAAQGRYDEAAFALSTASTKEAGPSPKIAASMARLLPDVETLKAGLPSEEVDAALVGAYLIRRSRYADALELGEWLKEAMPGRPVGFDVQVRAHLALGIPEAAFLPAQRMLDFYGEEHPIAYLRLAQVLGATGDLEGAQAVLSEGFAQHPDSLLLALRLVRLGLERVAATEGTNDEILVGLEGLLEEIRPLALAQVSSRAAYHYLRGRVLHERGLPRQSLRAFEASLRENPDHVFAREGALKAALALGDIDLAERLFDGLREQLSDAELGLWEEEIRTREETVRARGLIGGSESSVESRE